MLSASASQLVHRAWHFHGLKALEIPVRCIGRPNTFDAASKASMTFAIAASGSAAWLVLLQLDFQTRSGVVFAAALSLIAGVCAYFSFRKLLNYARRRTPLFALTRGAGAALLSFLITAALLALGVALAHFVQSVRGLPAASAWPLLLQSLDLGWSCYSHGCS
jgi:hypothetical protein